MLYLLDANVLIDANRDYYPLEGVPEFWEWLEHQGSEGRVKIAAEVVDEIKRVKDDLSTWIRTDGVRDFLLFDEDAAPSLVNRAVRDGYGPDLTDDELLKVGNDPFLVAYGLVDSSNRCVVTTEVSKPSKQRANRHLPDVCRILGVRCCGPFDLTRDLRFRTSWNRT